MGKDEPLAKWLNEYMEREMLRSEDMARLMDLSESSVSKLRNGIGIPDPTTIEALARATKTDKWYLAGLAYKWEQPAPTDPLLKEPGVRDLAVKYVELAKRDEHLADDLQALADTLLKQSKKRKRS